MKLFLSRFVPITMILILLSQGCGDSGFKGQNGTASQAFATPSENDDSLDESKVGQGTVEGGEVEIAPPNEKEIEAIGNCSQAWGLEAPPEFESIRKIKANVSIGSSGTTLSDLAKTDSPSFTLIYAAVTVGGEPVWQLTNPNGWYCIVVAVNVATNLTVQLDQNGKLADSKVSVNVGSEVDENISAVGVNVGSNVTVERL